MKKNVFWKTNSAVPPAGRVVFRSAKTGPRLFHDMLVVMTRLNVHSAKPPTLKSSMNLASELIRSEDQGHLEPESKVRDVNDQKARGDEQMEVLLALVMGLWQDVKSLRCNRTTLRHVPSDLLSMNVTAPLQNLGSQQRSRYLGWACEPWEVRTSWIYRRSYMSSLI